MTATKNEAFPEPTEAEVARARADGIKEAIKESTKLAYMAGTNEGYGEGDTPKLVTIDNGVFHLQHLLGDNAEGLEAAIDEKAEPAISEGRIAGLLEMERSGKNRTDVVKVLMKRLKIKSPYEVTPAGPAWTNDTTNISKL